MPIAPWVNVIFEKLLKSEDGLASNEVTSVAVDASGQIWLGTAGEGVCILQTDSSWRFISTQTLALLSDDVLDIAVCGSVVGVGTAGGVTIFDDGVFRKFFNGTDWGRSGCDSAIAVSCDGIYYGKDVNEGDILYTYITKGEIERFEKQTGVLTEDEKPVFEEIKKIIIGSPFG